jgi:hypothetical protein
MKRIKYVGSIRGIDKTGMVAVKTCGVIKYLHASNAVNPIVAVPNSYISNSTNPSVVVVENRDVFNLNHGAKIVILNIGPVIKP